MNKHVYAIGALLALLLCVAVPAGHAQKFLSSIAPAGSLGGAIPSDIKVVPTSGSASKAQSAEGIDKSFDGDLSTLYHSPYTNGSLPVTLQWNFAQGKTIDYLVYYPRTSGTNGIFQEIQLTYKLYNQSETVAVTCDFGGIKSPTTYDFPTSLVNVEYIKIVVNSGLGGYASCAEMEFYAKNPLFGEIFADKLKSQLNPGVTEAQLQAQTNPLIRELGLALLNDANYREFRVGEFPPHESLTTLYDMAGFSNGYDMYENPTGIYFGKGKHAIWVEGIPVGQSVALLIPDYQYILNKSNPKDWSLHSRSYPLKNGVNIVEVTGWDGLGYISYFRTEALAHQAETVKCHFMLANVQGYFDVTKHNNAKWADLLSKANYYHVMDVMGKKAHVCYTVDGYRQYSPNNGVEVITAYDTLMAVQHRAIGFEKYGHIPTTNHLLNRVNYSYFMYKDADGTAYKVDEMQHALTIPFFARSDNWGFSHEIGHNHQIPDFNWKGLGEVSVNIPGIYYDIIKDIHVRPDNTGLQNGIDAIIKTNKAHSMNIVNYNDHRLMPFAQLFYYFHQQGNDDFYPDLYEYLRTHRPTKEERDGMTVPDYEMNFIRAVCAVSGVNLLPFFKKWGFVYATDAAGHVEFDADADVKFPYRLTTAKLNAFETEINGKGYTVPAEDITKINARGEFTLTTY